MRRHGFLFVALGLLFGAINVAFRDAQSFVEIIVMCAMWASPVMYQWSMVRPQLGEVGFLIYCLNPLTVAVELFHAGFWFPLNPENGQLLPDLWTFAGLALLISLLTVVVGQLVFRRLEGRFAQEL